ncbi:PQQ-dependent sugar dehydrogenase [Fodinibius salsisoli]|uniref:PQQ-dependent sugar dehydrogenase n=1 Tax=Fodinibius salsisoli TaxID=2820877 RepID=A0ABT3PLW6_9BACT|nr:PQQ-dependent sugar dehydrogenase [Fodinibius salsisoli]MCW9706753.1 PQQ-dependent sugar dehydrogenase [Fodinibius salsisoli]
MIKRLQNKYINTVILLGICSLFIFSGYLVGLHQLPSYGFFRRVELNVFGFFFDRIAEPDDIGYYDSIFLRLYNEKTNINDRLNREGRGGGLTSVGDDVLLLTYDGQIFQTNAADDIRNTNIMTPDNGFMAYRRTSETEPYNQYTHSLRLFRYNDIMYYSSEENNGLAISYSEFDSTQTCYHNTVATLPIQEGIESVDQLTAQPEDWKIIYRSQPCLPLKREHYAIDGGLAGGRMAFRAPSSIFLGNGDYEWDGMNSPIAIAQDPNGEYGKIMHIDLTSGESRIYATGIRNPQGIVFDNNGALWTVEHGVRGGDELNRIEENGNYGWPEESLGTQYSRLPIPTVSEASYGHHQNYTAPVFAWLPSVAISNLTLIDGFESSWNGDLLMGSLKSMSLFRIRIKDNRALFTEKIEIGERIRYVHQHTDGHIILWTDHKNLIFLNGQPYTDNYVTDYLEEQISNPEVREKVKFTIDACRQCHSIEPNDNITAPSLSSIFEAEIASTDYQAYSNALKRKDGMVWTSENLQQFLTAPQEFAPGTNMPDPGLNDGYMVDELIKFLEALNNKTAD